MLSKSVLLCLGVVFLVAISEARPAGDSKDKDDDDDGSHHHHHHTHHTHHHHHTEGSGSGGDGSHTHHHKGETHTHHYHTDGSTHHHREDDGGDSESSSDGNKAQGSPSLINSPDVNLSGDLGGDGKGPSGSLNVGGLNADLSGKLPDVDLGNLGGDLGDLAGKLPDDVDLGNLNGDLGDLAGKLPDDVDLGNLGGDLGDLAGKLPDLGGKLGGDLNLGGDGGDDDGEVYEGVEGGDGGLARDGSGGLRVPPFLDPRGELIGVDGGTPPQDLVQRLRDAGVDLTGISPAVLTRLASHKYGHLGVDSTAPRDCMDEYGFNDGVLKHFVRGTRDAGDALLSGLHDLIGEVVGGVGILQNLDDGLLRGLQQLLCGAENGFSDFASDFDSATHIAKHGLIDIFKLQGDGLLAFPEGILGIGEEALEAIGSAAGDAVNAIGRGLETLEEHVVGIL